MSGSMHVLPNGLTVAVDPIAGSGVRRHRSVRERRVALRAGAAQRSRASRRAYGVQGRRQDGTRARSPKRSKMSAEASTPGQRATRPCSTAARSAATRRSSPSSSPTSCARRTSTKSISSARSRSILSELGESVDSPDDLVHDHLFEAAFDGQAIGRPVLGSEESVRADHAAGLLRVDREQFVPSRLVLAASGKVDPDARPCTRRAAVRRHAGAPSARSRIRAFTGGVRNDRRELRTGALVPCLPGPAGG